MDTHHQLTRVVDLNRLVTGWLYPGGAHPKRIGKVQGSPYRRPAPPGLGHEQASSQPHQMGIDFPSATPRGMQRGVAGQRDPLRAVVYAPPCSGRVPTLHGRAGWMQAHDVPICSRQSLWKPHLSRYKVPQHLLPFHPVRCWSRSVSRFHLPGIPDDNGY